MEKQLILMIVTTVVGVVGSFLGGPFFGIMIYYVYSVVRPQYAWKYQLPQLEFGWSYMVAMSAIVATIIFRLGLLKMPAAGPSAGTKRPMWNTIHYAVLAFAFWVTMSYWFAVDRDSAHVHFVEYFKMFFVFTIACLSVQRVSQLWILLAALALADAFVGYEINTYYFKDGRRSLEWGGADNNGAGLQLAMGIPLCYFLWESTVSRFRWVYLVGAAMMAHAVLLSDSRGAMLSVLVSAPVLFFFSQRKKALIAIGAIGVAFVLLSTGPEVQNRFLSISEHEADDSANSRKTTWMIAIRMANEKPFLGFGLRCSSKFTQEYGADMEGRVIHSQYFQIAADMGWIGLFWFLLLLIAVTLLTHRLWRRTRHWPKTDTLLKARSIAGAVLASLTVYCVGGIFLSLDHFELPYALFLIAAQLWSVYRSQALETIVRAEAAAQPHLMAAAMPVIPRPRYAPIPPPFRKSPNPVAAIPGGTV